MQGCSYSPVVRVKADETSTELLNIERSLYELSQRQQLTEQEGAATNVRHSFLSVDSGRTSSDTYDTSSSSVSSASTNHSNRLNSTASNCSGDSGTQMSLGSADYGAREPSSVLTNIQVRGLRDISWLCSHWSTSYITALALVESFMVLKYFHNGSLWH